MFLAIIKFRDSLNLYFDFFFYLHCLIDHLCVCVCVCAENGNISYVYELPSELFDQIVPNLPPLALQNLQDAMYILFSVSCFLSC